MRLEWEGKDITSVVNITACVYRDVSTGRCDLLDMTLDHADLWYSWGPKTDDKVRVTHDDFDTGVMYLHTIKPIRDSFRVIAISLPSSAMHRAWKSYDNTTLQSIASECASECGMSASFYGVNSGVVYKYMIRANQGCAGFMDKLGQMEGFMMKAYNGKMRCIGIEYAQGLSSVKTFDVDTEQQNIRYEHFEQDRIGELSVCGSFGSATATDSNANSSNKQTIGNLPAQTSAEARRWARNMLLAMNRKTEIVTLDEELDPTMTANVRVTIIGSTDAKGDWLVDEAEHDLFNGHTRVKLLRSINTIR